MISLMFLLVLPQLSHINLPNFLPSQLLNISPQIPHLLIQFVIFELFLPLEISYFLYDLKYNVASQKCCFLYLFFNQDQLVQANQMKTPSHSQRGNQMHIQDSNHCPFLMIFSFKFHIISDLQLLDLQVAVCLRKWSTHFMNMFDLLSQVLPTFLEANFVLVSQYRSLSIE